MDTLHKIDFRSLFDCIDEFTARSGRRLNKLKYFSPTSINRSLFRIGPRGDALSRLIGQTCPGSAFFGIPARKGVNTVCVRGNFQHEIAPVYNVRSRIYRVSSAGIIHGGISFGSPISIQIKIAGFFKYFFRVFGAICICSVGRIIPPCKIISYLFRRRKLNRVSVSLILCFDARTAAAVEDNGISKDFRMYPIRLHAAVHKPYRYGIASRFRKSNLRKRRTVGNGNYIPVVYLNFIAFSSDNRPPRKDSSRIFHRGIHLIVTDV